MRKLFLAASILGALALSASAADKKLVVMIAGKPSHGAAQHEHNAGIQLLAKCLAQGAADRVETRIHLNGEWPSADELAKAASIVIYSDGGAGHPAIQDDRLAQLEPIMKRGTGFVCLHYAVEVPKDKGGPEFLRWLGGYFETDWSVNPHWQADFTTIPKHPVTAGVKPFSTNDEWYFHMRFPEGMKGVTPILTAIPPESTMSRKDGPHEGNPTVRAEVAAKKPQHVAWAFERPDGGRAFGFTGGHFHNGWGNDDQRKLVLNAIVWTAKAEIPAGGVQSKVTPEDLTQNLDPKPAPKPKAAAPAPAK
jgi:type 1 glutamine amidotransferase